jgi:hypothetical protein
VPLDSTGTEFERIPIAEWARLQEALGRFCAGGVEVDGGRLTCRCGSATFTVSRAGDVEAGMPLHGFATSGVEAVGVDATGGRLLVEAGETQYVFRHP